jgi:hypothetical protein
MNSTHLRRVIAAGMIGNVLEWSEGQRGLMGALGASGGTVGMLLWRLVMPELFVNYVQNGAGDGREARDTSGEART